MMRKTMNVDGFDDIIQGIKNEFSNLNHGARCYELKIILPAINMFINGAHGVIFAPNYFSAINSMRIMFEGMGALAYFEVNDPSNESFNAFLRKAIIQMTNEEVVVDDDMREQFYGLSELLRDKNPRNGSLLELLSGLERIIDKDLWVNVSIRKQLDAIDSIVCDSGAKKLYDKMCEITHFGSKQIMSIIDDLEVIGDQSRISWMIGPKLLSDENRVLMQNIVFDAYEVMAGIIRFSARNNNGQTKRFNYQPAENNKLIPKEYKNVSPYSK